MGGLLRDGDGEMPSERMQTKGDPAIDVRVAWSRDCEYVQLAVISQDPDKAKAMAKGIADQLETRGDQFVDSGWHAGLDRDGLNQLIKTVRRARDQAYGKDE